MTSSNDASGTACRALSGRRFPSGRTILISGGSRGIGLAIALRAARDGANMVLLAKTGQPHATLEGTVYYSCRTDRGRRRQALPLVGDVRNDADVAGAVGAAVERFGGIDIVINNASAIDLSTNRHRGHEALRPHAGHQRPRHVPALQAGPSGAARIRGRATS